MNGPKRFRVEPKKGPEVDEKALAEINALPRLARAIRALTEDGGAVPADSKHVEAAIRADLDPDIVVEPAHLDALVALGTLQRVMIGNVMHLVWRSDARDTVTELPVNVQTPKDPEEEDLAFRLDIALDVERERLLFYRVILVLEVLAASLLIRQLLLWYLQG